MVTVKSKRLTIADDQRALIEEHIPLIKKVVDRYFFKHARFDISDLYQVGFIGLAKAAQAYDVSKGVLFRVYAKHRILGEVRDYLRTFVNPGSRLRKRCAKVVNISSLEDDDHEFDAPGNELNVIPFIEKFREGLIELVAKRCKRRRNPKMIITIYLMRYLQGKRMCQIARQMNHTDGYISQILRLIPQNEIEDIARQVMN